MKYLIKKLFLIFILFFVPKICFGAETLNINLGSDYLITTQKSIKTSVLINPDIATINPFFTIFNEKNVLLLHPKKVGKTILKIVADNKENSFEINVKSKTASLTDKAIKLGDFEFFIIDAPPVIEDLKLDLPPLRIKKGE